MVSSNHMLTVALYILWIAFSNLKEISLLQSKPFSSLSEIICDG